MDSAARTHLQPLPDEAPHVWQLPALLLAVFPQPLPQRARQQRRVASSRQAPLCRKVLGHAEEKALADTHQLVMGGGSRAKQ